MNTIVVKRMQWFLSESIVCSARGLGGGLGLPKNRRKWSFPAKMPAENGPKCGLVAEQPKCGHMIARKGRMDIGTLNPGRKSHF